MQLSRRVALNGVQLDSVDSRILIQSVEPAAGRDQITAVGLAGGSGSRVTGEHRDTLDIVVKFSINEKSWNMEARAGVLEKVIAWAAGGGILTVNYKPGRRVTVKAAQMPGEGDIRKRGNAYAVTFRAFAVPYWEDAAETTQEIGTDAIGNSVIIIGGSAQAQVGFTLENTSGSTISSVTLNAGEKEMAFADLGLADGETLIIDHTDSGLLRIRIMDAEENFRSAMAARSGANDFRIDAGTHGCGYIADGACTVTASWRARYL